MPEDNKKINIVHTPCKNCVFAVTEDNKQIGCLSGALDRFRLKGYEVLNAYDNESEFFVINNKKCIFLRNAEWWNKNALTNTDDALLLAQKENNIKYIALIKIDNKVSLETFTETITKICKNTISPSGILLYMDQKNNSQIKTKTLADILNKSKIQWRIQKFVDDLNETQKIKHIIQAAPINRYYFYIDPNHFNSSSFDLEGLNNKILDGLTFGCISIAGGLFFSYLTWQYAKANKNIDILLDTQYQIPYENIE